MVEVLMPRLGWTMEEGLFVEWLKHDGEPVRMGDILFTVETDKALNEVECLNEGVLRVPPGGPAPGAMVKVGALLGYIVEPGEDAPFAAGPSAPATVSATSTPAAPMLAKLTASKAAEPDGKQDEPAISPRARRAAAELGLDPRRLTGSGRTGRIVERDVLAGAAALLAETRPSPPPIGAPAAGQPMTSARRLIAARLSASVHTTAPVTLTTEVDATELVRLRSQLKNDPAASKLPVPSYTDLLAKAAAHALLEHPALNARLEGDAIVESAAVHMGLAVDTERGLLVPVLRDVQAKGLRQLAQESAALIERARSGRLSPDELRGGTFSLTNLGMYDIDLFTPIINLPECAILGLGRIVAKQVVVDAALERLAIQQMMGLSLTFDHRLVDGAPAARFLQRVKTLVEQPYLWLVA